MSVLPVRACKAIELRAVLSVPSAVAGGCFFLTAALKSLPLFAWLRPSLPEESGEFHYSYRSYKVNGDENAFINKVCPESKPSWVWPPERIVNPLNRDDRYQGENHHSYQKRNRISSIRAAFPVSRHKHEAVSVNSSGGNHHQHRRRQRINEQRRMISARDE